MGALGTEHRELIAMRGKDQDPHLRRNLPHRFHHAEPIEGRQVQIEQHQVGFRGRDHVDRPRPVLGLAHHIVPEIIRAHLPQDFAEHQMVFNDDNPHGDRWKWRW